MHLFQGKVMKIIKNYSYTYKAVLFLFSKFSPTVLKRVADTIYYVLRIAKNVSCIVFGNLYINSVTTGFAIKIKWTKFSKLSGYTNNE
jgi:hypothetical protein